MNNLDYNQYNDYNNYDNNYNSYYNDNNNNNNNNNYNYNNNYNNNYNYNNQNNMYSSYLNNSTNDFNINRTYSDYSTQPPAQKLVKAPTMDNTNGINSLNSNYNNNDYNSWSNYNTSSNYLFDNQPYNMGNSDGNIYSDRYSSSFNDYSTFRRSNSVLNRNHSRHNSLNNIYDNDLYNSSSRLYNTYNKSQEFYNNDTYNNSLYVTNDNFGTVDNDLKLSKYRTPSYRRMKSSLKECVDSNYYNNNYDGNPKYYKYRQPSKVTFDKNVQYC